jgi:hypothetical protein
MVQCIKNLEITDWVEPPVACVRLRIHSIEQSDAGQTCVER